MTRAHHENMSLPRAELARLGRDARTRGHGPREAAEDATSASVAGPSPGPLRPPAEAREGPGRHTQPPRSSVSGLASHERVGF